MKKSSRRILNELRFAMLLACLGVPAVGHSGLVAGWGASDAGQIRLPSGATNVKAISAGADHTLALKSDGTLLAWGLNYYNYIPPGLSNVAAISAGGYHNLALKVDGTVVGWGDNQFGQSLVPPDLTNTVAVAAGFDHNLALKDDGTVVAWGRNYFGETKVPPGLTNVRAIAGGGVHSLALKADGTVVAWGDNSEGQTNVPAGLANVIAIGAGLSHSLALKADGTVVAWGANSSGESDVPTNLANIVAISTRVSHNLALRADGTIVAWGFNSQGQTNVPGNLARATAIAAGRAHSLALVAEGPVQIIQEPQSQGVPYTSNVTFAVVATGHGPVFYQWYLNGAQMYPNAARFSGVTGATLTISNLQFSDIGTYSVVVSNPFGSVISSGAMLAVISPPFITQQPVNRTVRAGSDVTLMAAAGGTPHLWNQWFLNGIEISRGFYVMPSLTNVQPADSGIYFMRVTNLYGIAETVRASLTVTDSPPYILTQPANQMVSIGGSVVLRVSARGSTPLSYQWRFNGNDVPGATNATLALDQLRYDQTGFYNVTISNAFGGVISAKAFVNVSQVLAWGDPFSGNTNAPPGLTNVIAIAAGGSHITALKADGTVRTWLANAQYIFGSSTGITNVPTSATNVIAIAAGRDHSLALRSNGTVVAWGGNLNGQINVPTGVSNVVAVTAGWYRSYAVRSDGTVVGWGSQATVPVGLSNVVAIAAGTSHNLALQRDGTVTAWGSPSIAIDVPLGLSNVIAIASGVAHNLALKRDGTIVAWGDNTYGQTTRIPAGVSNVVAIAEGSYVSVVLKQDGTVVSWGNWGQKNPTLALSNIVAIAAGGVQAGFGLAVIGNGSPAFTLQPASQITSKGATVRLHARAAGVQPMSFQWQLNGANLPAATNVSLTITNLQGKDTGGYRVIAANALGSAVSATAQVTIPFSTNLTAALGYQPRGDWTTGLTNTAWFAQIRETHDGDVAAQSGPITHNQQSPLQTGFFSGSGTVTFWWKISSEEGFDFLRLYLDQSTIPLASISGETAWQQQTVHIATGGQTLKWIYAKDGSVSDGQDAGWLDEVVFTPDPPVITLQPTPPSTIASMGTNVTVRVTATGLGPLSYQWLKNSATLTGATQTSLTLTNVTRRDSGTYAVRVSNVGGSTLSSNGTLVVRVPQRLKTPVRLADGSFLLMSGDVDGGALLPGDLAAFEGQASTNLLNWETLPTVLSLTNGSLVVHDPGSTNFPVRFYRMVEH